VRWQIQKELGSAFDTQTRPSQRETGEKVIALKRAITGEGKKSAFQTGADTVNEEAE